MSSKEPSIETELQTLQRESFCCFLHETNPENGLAKDKTEPGWPASIAATGFALASYPVGIERGFMSRAAAAERTRRATRVFMVPRRLLWVNGTFKDLVANPLLQAGSAGLLSRPLERWRIRLLATA